MTNTIENQLHALALRFDCTLRQLLADNGICEIDLDQAYDDMLDDVYPVVAVGGSTFFPSRVLQELDPTAYRCGYSDYVDSYYYSNADYISFDNGETYYLTEEVEKLIEELEAEATE